MAQVEPFTLGVGADMTDDEREALSRVIDVDEIDKGFHDYSIGTALDALRVGYEMGRAAAREDT